jgi:hypothetical protein
LKEIVIDPNKITLRVLGKFRKAMQTTTEVTDPEEQLEKQAKLLAELTDNWTVDDVLDLPLKDFIGFKDAIDQALNGIVPNGSATNS